MAAEDVESQRKMREIAEQLRRVAASLQDLASLLSEEKIAPRAEPFPEQQAATLVEQLRRELGASLQQVDIVPGQTDLQIRPKGFLGAEVFRSVADVARKHRGRWDGGRRCFMVPLR